MICFLLHRIYLEHAVLAKMRMMGVVNEDFKVFNYDNLFVVDSSIFPHPTSYNPQLTIMIYAKLASNIILNE